MCFVVLSLFHYHVYFLSLSPPPFLPISHPPILPIYICEVKTIVGADADQIMQTIKQLQ